MSRNSLEYMYILLAIVICSIILLYIIKQNTLYNVEFYTARKTTTTEKHGIPLILHEYWHSRHMPYHMSMVVKRHIEMNPEFDVYIYSEKEAIEFLKQHFHSDVLDAYNGLKPSAFKSDLFRYCVLYIKGGVYIDTKMDFYIPFANLIRDSRPLFLRPDEPWCEDGRGVATNYIIAPPNWDILRTAIDEIVKAHKAKLYKENELDVTGPCLIGDILNKKNQREIRENSRCVSSEENGHFVITCDNKVVARSYNEYRDEQSRMQKEPGYKVLYKKKDIYW